MRYLGWLLKALVFFAFLIFALRNRESATMLDYLVGAQQVKLNVVMLACFVLGAVLGILASVGQVIRLRRELLALKRELRASAKAPAHPPVDAVLD